MGNILKLITPKQTSSAITLKPSSTNFK